MIIVIHKLNYLIKIIWNTISFFLKFCAILFVLKLALSRIYTDSCTRTYTVINRELHCYIPGVQEVDLAFFKSKVTKTQHPCVSEIIQRGVRITHFLQTFFFGHWITNIHNVNILLFLSLDHIHAQRKQHRCLSGNSRNV